MDLGELSVIIIGTSMMLVWCAICWGIAATLRNSFTHRTGRMWLDNVGCTGMEENIGLCLGWGVNSTFCSHSREAGVICGGIGLAFSKTVSDSVCLRVRCLFIL